MRRALASAVEAMDRVVAHAARHLAARDQHEAQTDLYELAFLASEAAALRCVAGDDAAVPEPVAVLAGSQLVRSARHRLDGRAHRLGVDPEALDEGGCRELSAAGHDAALHLAVLDAAGQLRGLGLSEDLRLAAAEFRRFGREMIAPHADTIHREDRDIPDEIIDGLAAMGAFGLSIPESYGGSQEAGSADHLAMVVATEELSRVSLGAGGSLITRPEILARALVVGGTEEQRRRWLPAIASGERLVAVAVTEPDVGSDVASLSMQARHRAGGWVLRGTKTWSTFAGRADLLMVLARSEEDPTLGHRGLSLFVVEKPRMRGHHFELTQAGGGHIAGRAIPTIGYRGMHSFEVVFDDWVVPADAIVGGEAGRGRGFHLQMDAFAAGRLQTAARAVGVMQAAFDAARAYAAERRVFGRRLDEYPLVNARLADMAARIAANRMFAYAVARYLSQPDGQLEASMVKALSCRAAEEITRDAVQIFGGYGYAEEYPISRYFVDARVLSIFEGAEEVLALKVIGRRLLAGVHE
jgi:(2S)-methylsuccinyl-CoA dehydrogenase